MAPKAKPAQYTLVELNDLIADLPKIVVRMKVQDEDDDIQEAVMARAKAEFKRQLAKAARKIAAQTLPVHREAEATKLKKSESKKEMIRKRPACAVEASKMMMRRVRAGKGIKEFDLPNDARDLPDFKKKVAAREALEAEGAPLEGFWPNQIAEEEPDYNDDAAEASEAEGEAPEEAEEAEQEDWLNGADE